VQRVGAWWRLPGHDHAPPERERLLLERVLPQLHAGGFDPPWVRTLAADFGLAEDDVRAVLRRAAARGELFQVVPDLFYAPARTPNSPRSSRSCHRPAARWMRRPSAMPSAWAANAASRS
jgi:hypothetical protein